MICFRSDIESDLKKRQASGKFLSWRCRRRKNNLKDLGAPSIFLQNVFALARVVCYAGSIMRSYAKKAVFCLLLALLLLPWPLSFVTSAEAGEVTASCTYDLPENVPLERLTDDSLLTRLTLHKRKDLSVALPACNRPSLYVTWFTRPGVLTVTELNEGGKLIRTTDATPATPFERYELDPACRKVVLSSAEECTLKGFEESIRCMFHSGEPGYFFSAKA